MLPIPSTAASLKGDFGVISGPLPSKVVVMHLLRLPYYYGVYGISYWFIKRPSAQQQQAEKVTLGLYLALYPAKFSSCPCMGFMLYMIFPMVSMVSPMGSSIVADVFHGIFYGLYAILYGFYGTSYGLNSNHKLSTVFPMGLVGFHISYTIYHSNMVSISRFCSMTLVLLLTSSNGLYAISLLVPFFSLCLLPFKLNFLARPRPGGGAPKKKKKKKTGYAWKGIRNFSFLAPPPPWPDTWGIPVLQIANKFDRNRTSKERQREGKRARKR